jgi:hypothetical protein
MKACSHEHHYAMTLDVIMICRWVTYHNYIKVNAWVSFTYMTPMHSPIYRSNISVTYPNLMYPYFNLLGSKSLLSTNEGMFTRTPLCHDS